MSKREYRKQEWRESKRNFVVILFASLQSTSVLCDDAECSNRKIKNNNNRAKVFDWFCESEQVSVEYKVKTLRNREARIV